MGLSSINADTYGVTQGWGGIDQSYNQFGAKGHPGLDVGANFQPIYNEFPGTISNVVYGHPGYGNYVQVTDIDGDRWLYAHLSEAKCAVGQYVKRGEVIAISGNSGFTTGPHCHIECFPSWGGSPDYYGTTDPLSYLSKETRDIETVNISGSSIPSDAVVVGSIGVNIRQQPNRSSQIIKTISNDWFIPQGYVTGEDVQGDNRWIKSDSGYSWWGAYDVVPQSIKNIDQVTVQPQAQQTISTSTATHIAKEPGLTEVTLSPQWISYNSVLDSNDIYSAQENYDYYLSKGNATPEYNPVKLVCHWWGLPSDGATHDGVVNHFISTDNKSVHFVVSANRITRMVPLNNVAYTTGIENTRSWSMEIDPQLTEDVYKTAGWLLYEVERLNPSLYNETLHHHKEFMSTACSNVDLLKVRSYANKFMNGELSASTGEAQQTVQPVAQNQVAVTSNTEALSSATRFIARIATQIAAVKLACAGIEQLLHENFNVSLGQSITNWACLAATVVVIFWNQVGYKLNAKYKWFF